MKTLGNVLLTIGFLGASYVSVLSPENVVDWRYFVPALAVGVAGVAVARFAIRQEIREEGQLTSNVETLESSIARIVDNLTLLDAGKHDLHPYDVHRRIDELFPKDLVAFVNARESLAHVYGLQAYARVMNEFAAGERYLNRVWSASVDCYIDDVHEYLGRAKEQFSRTQAALRAERGAAS